MIRLLLIPFFLCFFLEFYAQETLRFKPIVFESGTYLKKGTYGLNNNTFSASYHIDHPSFLKAYRDLGSPTIRYPGGTVANYINLKTGKAKAWENASAKSQLRVKNLNRSIQRNGKRYGASELKSFIKFAKNYDVNTTFVLNISSMSLKDTDFVLQKIFKAGVSLKCVELGNELYFGTYKDVVKNVDDYLTLAKERSLLVKTYFPNAKIGVLLPSHVYTHESFLDEVEDSTDRQINWYKALQKETFYDALVLHLYATNGMNFKTPKKEFLDYKDSYRFSISHADGKYKSTMQAIDKDFPNKEVWLTEYHVGGFGGAVRSYRLRYSYLGALFASNFMMKLFASPQVSIGSWHSMVQMLRYPKTVGKQLDKNATFKKTVNYHFFKAFKTPVKNSTHFVEAHVSNAKGYKGVGKYTAQYSDVETGVFYNPKTGKCYVMLFNKWENTYNVERSNIEFAIDGHIQNSFTILPDTNLDYSTALCSETTFSRVFSSQRTDTFAIPPFSMTIIECQRN